jgi:hypothetical protein
MDRVTFGKPGLKQKQAFQSNAILETRFRQTLTLKNTIFRKVSQPEVFESLCCRDLQTLLGEHKHVVLSRIRLFDKVLKSCHKSSTVKNNFITTFFEGQGFSINALPCFLKDIWA